jgi:hypothetical protein
MDGGSSQGSDARVVAYVEALGTVLRPWAMPIGDS